MDKREIYSGQRLICNNNFQGMKRRPILLLRGTSKRTLSATPILHPSTPALLSGNEWFIRQKHYPLMQMFGAYGDLVSLGAISRRQGSIAFAFLSRIANTVRQIQLLWLVGGRSLVSIGQATIIGMSYEEGATLHIYRRHPIFPRVPTLTDIH